MKATFTSALAVTVTLAILATPVAAIIIYTPLRTTVDDNGEILIDLNRDRTPDFTVQVSSRRGVMVCRGNPTFVVSVKIIPNNPGGGVVISSPALAQLLPLGADVGSSSNFEFNTPETIFAYNGCPMMREVAGYVGLAFQINGAIHYGWTYVRVYMDAYSVRTTVFNYAYESIADRDIVTGQLVGM